MEAFHQDLTGPLADAAVNLAVQGQPVNDGADIADRHIAHQVDAARIGINLHFANVTAVGVVRRLAGKHPFLGEARLHIRRQLLRLEGDLDHLVDGDFFIRAGDHKAAVVEFDIAETGLQNMRGDFAPLFDQPIGRRQRRARAVGGDPGAAGAVALGQRVRVPFDHPHPIRIDAEPVADHDLVHGGMALAIVGGADGNRRAAVFGKSNIGEFLTDAARGLHVVGETEAAQLARFGRSLFARRKSGEIDLAQRVVHAFLELPAVIDRTQRRLMRHDGGRDDITPAQLEPVDAGLFGRDVDQPLQDIRRVGPV